MEVLPSDRFPVDGLVTSGSTAVDESSLTGEPMPVPKVPGDTVRAGTLSVGDGAAVRVKATATGERSVLASVIALVEDAQVRTDIICSIQHIHMYMCVYICTPLIPSPPPTSGDVPVVRHPSGKM